MAKRKSKQNITYPSEELQNAINDAKSVLMEAMKQAEESAGVNKHSSNPIQQGVETANETLSEAKDQLEENVKERPLQSLGMAAGVGVLLGMWLNR